MVLIVSPPSILLNSINDIDNILYLLSVIIVQPLLVVLLVIIIPMVYLFNGCYTDRMARLHVAVYNIVHYIYRVIPVDYTEAVPRFVLYGYLSPIEYSYILLYTSIMVGCNCLYWFWNTAFIITTVSCNITSYITIDNSGYISNSTIDGGYNSSIDSNCISIEFNGIRGAHSAVSLFAAIVVVYAFALEILLKFTKGKALCTGNGCATRISSYKLGIVILVQVVLLFVAKPYYISNIIAANYTNDIAVEAINERHSSYSLSLILDTLCFVMMTPWWLFEKKVKTAHDDLTVMYIYQRFQETKQNINVKK